MTHITRGSQLAISASNAKSVETSQTSASLRQVMTSSLSTLLVDANLALVRVRSEAKTRRGMHVGGMLALPGCGSPLKKGQKNNWKPCTLST